MAMGSLNHSVYLRAKVGVNFRLMVEVIIF